MAIARILPVVVSVTAVAAVTACRPEPKPEGAPAAVAPVTGVASAADVAVPSAAPSAPAFSAPILGATPLAQPSAEPDPNAPMALTVATGANVEVVLPANPTTGYAWKVIEPVDAHVKLVANDYESTPRPTPPGGPVIVGSGGNARITFQGVTAGAATVQLAYQRAWEKIPAAISKTLVFTVTDAGAAVPAAPPSGGAAKP